MSTVPRSELLVTLGQTLEFEVAAIKPAADCVLGPNGGGKLGRTSPGRIEVECTTMLSLMGGAYAVDEHLERQWIQVEGGPGWLRTEGAAVGSTTSISSRVDRLLSLTRLDADTDAGAEIDGTETK